MGSRKNSAVTIAAAFLLITCSATDNNQVHGDTCSRLASCSSCLEKSYCSWCVTKSKCTKQACGNDNVIYPKRVKALMSGPEFCPRAVMPENVLVFESGKRQIITVKITQIYLYMAFTQWRCKISLKGRETIVHALLLADEVYCDSAELINDTDNAYIDGNIEIMWDHNKTFDGITFFKVCRCDIDPSCIACSKS
ncbi:unnamed protein product [Chilo suppressalis]|uniref:Plexin TIG domain-containing protein n=1 Tax=Chilo suppressalis TaxID=168631 RepID=A0ABN8BGR9_CHISP|nr:unnamed protein product [Chilo suppressalis]